LLCASAWNDNGIEGKVRDEKSLLRSDFFPGLGWMLPLRIWTELGPSWPEAYWDDWLREPQQRKGRQIVRPEVCRTFHFGVHGVSNSQFGSYLNSIHLNQAYVDFASLDLRYLEADKWDNYYLTPIRASLVVTIGTFDEALTKGVHEMRITYSGFGEYESLANWAGVMPDVKAGVPRGAYRGIVTTYLKGAKLHLCPEIF
jgi:alpha-1,3-mannosyl-glycoprotein beta-1,2-N-acetylglucosaminyltransferase